MKTVNVKIADLTGAALDWAVASAVYAVQYNTDGEFGQATGWLVRLGGQPCVMTGEPVWVWYKLASFKPSTDWSQGGPLIPKYMMMVDVFEGTTEAKATGFEGCHAAHWTCFGATPLIAICRAVVGVHFGQTVDVPEVLV